MSEFWLISAPGDKANLQAWDRMNTVTAKANLSSNSKFIIPDLKVKLGHKIKGRKKLEYQQHGGGRDEVETWLRSLDLCWQSEMAIKMARCRLV